nr:GNAT family N-acetyltransferase [Sphingomonas laterariae]
MTTIAQVEAGWPPQAAPAEGMPARLHWDGLKPPLRTPMHHFIWSQACLDTIYPTARPHILMTRGGIGPFVRTRAIPTLVLAGAEELAEPIEPVYEDDAAAAALADAVLAEGLPVRLGHPPAETPFAHAFAAKAKATGIVISLPTAGSPFIDLDPSWCDGLARFSSRRRSDFRRMRARAEAAGPVSFHFHRPSPAEAGALLDKAIAVEEKGWKARAGTALAYDPVQRRFFRRYAELAAADGILRINFLTIGPAIAAMQIAAECDGRYWLFKIGYDEQFAHCSPGQLLMLESIARAAESGLQGFEFLGKAAAWTGFWAQTERPRVRMNYYPRNAVGLAAFTRDAAVIGQRRVRRWIAGSGKQGA